MQKEIYDVIVVGAGIVGCSTSYHLARSGLKVALVDKGSAAGKHHKLRRALLSPYESNVQAARITLAYAQGAVSHGAHLIEGRPVERLSCQGQRVVGVETTQGPMYGSDQL